MNVIHFLYFVCYSLLLQSYIIFGSSLQDAKNLHKFIMSNYEKNIRPIRNQRSLMDVYVKLKIRGLTDYDDLGGVMKLTGFLNLRWKDECIQWNPSDYGEIKYIKLPLSDVWSPKFVISNAVNDFYAQRSTDESIVNYAFNGQAQYKMLVVTTTACEADITRYPFDGMHCVVLYSLDGYGRTEVRLISNGSSLLGTRTNGKWILNVNSLINLTSDEYSVLALTVTLKRRPFFVVVFIVLPMLLLVVINCFTFIVPPESGEKISFAVTVHLSYAVFLTVVLSQMPLNAIKISILSYALILHLIYSTLIVIIAAINLHIYHKDDAISPVPQVVKKIMKCSRTKRVKDRKQTSDLQVGQEDCTMDTTNVQNNVYLQSSLNWKMVSTTIDNLCFKLFIVLTLVDFLSFSLYLIINDDSNI